MDEWMGKVRLHVLPDAINTYTKSTRPSGHHKMEFWMQILATNLQRFPDPLSEFAQQVAKFAVAKFCSSFAVWD